MDPATLLERIGLVLVEPRNPLNIGSALRAARNMGIADLRLVAPLNRDPAKIAITAPGLEAEAAALPEYATLEQAVADAALVLGFSARARQARREVWRLDELPERLPARLPDGAGRCYLIFGREDFGLSNEDLDRCHVLITIPTAPDYASLNLAQAVLLGAWTLRSLADAPALETRQAPPDLASAGEIAALLDHAESALSFVEFFKFDGAKTAVRRALSGVFTRAGLDRRDVRIFHGIFSEMVDFHRRKER